MAGSSPNCFLSSGVSTSGPEENIERQAVSPLSHIREYQMHFVVTITNIWLPQTEPVEVVPHNMHLVPRPKVVAIAASVNTTNWLKVT